MSLLLVSIIALILLLFLSSSEKFNSDINYTVPYYVKSRWAALKETRKSSNSDMDYSLPSKDPKKSTDLVPAEEIKPSELEESYLPQHSYENEEQREKTKRDLGEKDRPIHNLRERLIQNFGEEKERIPNLREREWPIQNLKGDVEIRYRTGDQNRERSKTKETAEEKQSKSMTKKIISTDNPNIWSAFTQINYYEYPSLKLKKDGEPKDDEQEEESKLTFKMWPMSGIIKTKNR